MSGFLHSAGSAAAIEEMSVSELLGLRGGGSAGVAGALGVLLNSFGEGFGVDGLGGSGSGLDSFLLLLVDALLLVSTLHFLLSNGLDEALLVVGNVKSLERIGHW